MKATCPYCRNQWYLTPEALALALEQTPAKGRSISVECPRCRRTVKLSRPRPAPTQLAPAAGQSKEDSE